MDRAKLRKFAGVVFVFASLSVLLISRQLLGAQDAQSQTTPPASVSVSVKMIDLADSQTDPAGKQYRASVAKLASAGNGVAVPQGSAAIVTLAQTPNGWTAQLASLTIAGQAVPVTSVSANVTSSAQSAAASAANTVSSVFGGFGHHAPPAAATAVATGQRVILPPGVTITFVLAAPPAPAAPDAAPAPAPAPEAPANNSTRPPIPAPASSAASPTRSPIPAPASNPAVASGQLTAMDICFSNPPPNPSDPNYKTQYLTAAFEVPVTTEGAIPVIEPAFSAYLKATYQLSKRRHHLPADLEHHRRPGSAKEDRQRPRHRQAEDGQYWLEIRTAATHCRDKAASIRSRKDQAASISRNIA